MHEMQTIAIDDPVAWASVRVGRVNLSWATVLTHLSDGVTSMQPLLHYCSHLFIFECLIIFCRSLSGNRHSRDVSGGMVFAG